MKSKTIPLTWIARIFAIAAIFFVSIFALDSFEEDTLLHKITAFVMHMIPSFILLIALLIAWKHELTGGILFMLIGFATAPFIYQMNFERTHSLAVSLEVIAIINLPFVIVGSLFTLSYYRFKKNK